MKTNSLKYSETKTGINYCGTKADIIVKIRLNDECKNGHQDFAITADIYKTGKRNDNAMLACGCMHEEIAKHFPKFKIFVQLHLCDYAGIPMYAVENGFYHLCNGFNDAKPFDSNFKTEFCEYYRIKPVQFDILNSCKNKTQYAVKLKELGILQQWNDEAKTAIAYLEELTGHEFLNDSVKTQYHEPTAEEIQQEKERDEKGYYTKEATEERERQRVNAIVEKMKSEAQKKIDNINEELNLMLSIADIVGVDMLDNIIYYNHLRKIKFNWKGYGNILSPEHIKKIKENLILPDGVIYEN